MLKPRLSAAAKTPAPRVNRRTGQWLQAQRQSLFRSEPWCRSCKASGALTIATIRDHIQPLFEGGADEPANIQPLCKDCHDRKSRSEMRRAVGWGG